MTGDEGHRGRIRQRFLREGLEHFQDYEVLELYLTMAIPRVDTKPIAKALLEHFGSLYRVMEASPTDLMRVKGIGQNAAFSLSLLPPMYRRYELDRNKKRKGITTTDEMGEYCKALFIGERYELSRVVLLNNSLMVLHEEIISRGTIDQVMIYARNVTELALRHQANYVVIAHNHPGGSLLPSSSDLEVTASMRLAIESIGASLLDHIIVAGDKHLSIKKYQEDHGIKSPDVELPSAQSKRRKETPPWVEDEEQAAEKKK